MSFKFQYTLEKMPKLHPVLVSVADALLKKNCHREIEFYSDNGDQIFVRNTNGNSSASLRISILKESKQVECYIFFMAGNKEKTTLIDIVADKAKLKREILAQIRKFDAIAKKEAHDRYEEGNRLARLEREEMNRKLEEANASYGLVKQTPEESVSDKKASKDYRKDFGRIPKVITDEILLKAGEYSYGSFGSKKLHSKDYALNDTTDPGKNFRLAIGAMCLSSMGDNSDVEDFCKKKDKPQFQAMYNSIPKSWDWSYLVDLHWVFMNRGKEHNPELYKRLDAYLQQEYGNLSND